MPVIEGEGLPVEARPQHPGRFLAHVLERHPGITQAELAGALGTSRLTVNEILNQRRNITAEMAVRLERVLGVDAEEWMHVQTTYDLHRARERLLITLPDLQVLQRE